MAKTINEFLQGYENWSPAPDIWGYRPTATRSPNGVYSWGNFDTGVQTMDPYQELYKAIASGEVAPTAEDWSQMFSSNNGIDANEWASLSPEVRAWAQSNPQAFMSQVLSMRNRANGDLLSMGAEGGFSSPGNVGINNGRMDFSNAGYMDINDEWYDSMDFWGPIVVGALAGGAGLLNGAQGAAGATSGLTSAQQGALFNGLGDTVADIAAGNGAFAGGGAGSLAEYFGVPQASFAGPAGSTPIMGSNGVMGYMTAEGAIIPASGSGAQAASMGLLEGVGAGAGSSVINAATNAAKPVADAGTGVTGSVLGNAGKLALAGAGALLGGTNGAKQAGTTTTTQAPWEKQQPYLTDVWSNAQSMFNNGSPLYGQATQNMQSLLGGPMYNPTMGLNNPYLENAIGTAQDEVVRKATGAFNNANRASGSFGNSGLQEAFARELPQQLANISTSMRMQDYGNQQNLFENAVNRTTAATGNANDFAWKPIQNYSNIVGSGNWGGTTQQPYYTNNASNILGGVATGVGLYNTLFGGK